MKKFPRQHEFLSWVYTVGLMWLTTALTAYTPARSRVVAQHNACSRFEKGPVVLYIHGTIFPLVAKFTRHHMERNGLYRYTQLPPDQQHKRLSMAQALCQADSKQFPSTSFYKFYWKGGLTMAARKKAAEEIYALLSSHEGPITIIAHSHGCNVALHLAELLQKEHQSLSIDRLILLAPPVQHATAQLISSSLFKRIYSFYSNADVLQVADPQGMYKKFKKSDTPLFSQRTYNADVPHLTQARVLMHYKSPGHRDFIHPEFFKHVPSLLEILDEAHTKETRHVMVNIPYGSEKPHLVELAQARKPRGIDHCTCNGKHQRVKSTISYHV